MTGRPTLQQAGSLAADKAWPALFEKGTLALFQVLTRLGGADELFDLVKISRVERQPGQDIEYPLGVLDRQRRVGRDLLSQLVGVRLDLLVRQHLVDEAETERLGG